MPSKTKELNEDNIKKNVQAKSTSKKTTKSDSTTKKVVSSKKAVVKNSVSKAKTDKKSSAKKSNKSEKSVALKTKKIASTAKKKVAEKKVKTAKPLAEVVEYYDLPYRYNETIVKILYQSPETLFVYWDIADSDRENYIKQYGENFFNITRPVLIVHNDTMGYSFEIPINDFANSWYLHVNDSKCNYRIELGRRPNYYNAEVTKEIQEKNSY